MDPDSSPPSRLRVIVTDGRGRPAADGGLARWLVRVAPSQARGELAIALVSDARMRTFNRAYRRKDYATDVLSFPGDSRPATRDQRLLGDLIIATGVARRQAREAGHSYQTELRVLALHGLLHLLGYDHESPRDSGRMARAEARLRRQGGLRTGLMERRADKVTRLPERSEGGKANQPPPRLRRSAGALAKAEGRRAKRVKRVGVGPHAH